MKNLFGCSLLFVILLTSAEIVVPDSDLKDSGNGHEWNYNATDENGPPNWKIHYPTCGLYRQSPIEFKTETTSYNEQLTDFTFDSYDKPAESGFTLRNTGKTIQIDVDGDADGISVSGGNLTGKYILSQLHFHWGRNPDEGSEHRLNGIPNSMEIHLVHWKESYGSFNTSLYYSDGVAVLGILVQANDDVSLSPPGLVNLTNYFQEIPNAGNSTSVPSFALDSLLPSQRTYYRYLGSLTTPECQESVVWTVFQNPISLTGSAISKFRSVFDSHGQPMEYNYRPVQDLFGRAVHTSLFTGSGQADRRPTLTVVLLAAVTSALKFTAAKN